MGEGPFNSISIKRGKKRRKKINRFSLKNDNMHIYIIFLISCISFSKHKIPTILRAINLTFSDTISRPRCATTLLCVGKN